jgi:acyl-[acyl-carrier-protein]-phospholipid O-acyltransferase / long-chain-fatty-acid--[acyl-carrier-protein] ligase
MIAKTVRTNKATLLLATPTFLRTYVRKATREDFQSLRLIITGAEKLRSELAQQCEARFGIVPLEGYGATELSPVAALNVYDVTQDRRRFVGNRPGTIGRPLPGIAVRVIDPDTAQPVQPGTPGLLLVKGANVMQGYLHNENATAEVLTEGWYRTGDIVAVAPDGFITLTDRLSRFSKMAGEMVPHGAVEDAIHRALELEEPALVVAAVPDDRRGERLVVLYTPLAGSEQRLHDAIREADLPNLWRPSNNDCYPIDEIPMLATGKMDLREIKRLARELARQPQSVKA